MPKLQRRSHFDNNQQRGETAEALKTASGQGCPLVYIIGKSEQLLVNKIFAQGDIFLQRIEHAFQRLLLKCA